MVTEDDVDAFYAATSRGLLSQLYGLTRDWAEAQDCPQEAYAHKGLYVLHSDGTGSRLLVKGIAVRAARWSPESRSLPTTAGGVTLNVVHVADGSVRQLLSPETYDADSATLALTHLPSYGAEQLASSSGVRRLVTLTSHRKGTAMSRTSSFLRLAATAAIASSLAVGSSGQASAATPHKALTSKQLLSLVRTLHFAPKGFYSSPKRGSTRPLPAAQGVCGSAYPSVIEVLDWAEKPGTQLQIAINQTKDAATAAKAFASLVDPHHTCKDERIFRPHDLPATARFMVQSPGGPIWRETVVAVEGSALVFASVQHINGGAFTAHDYSVAHFALHRTVAGYRAATTG